MKIPLNPPFTKWETGKGEAIHPAVPRFFVTSFLRMTDGEKNYIMGKVFSFIP
jgi:hypothetical protein